MKKLLSLLLTLSMLATCLAGCSTSAPGSPAASGGSSGKDKGTDTAQEVEVGIVLPTKDEPRWLHDQAQFESLLDDAGFTSQVLFSQGSSATEKTNVETLISQGIKVLIICAQDASAAAAAVETAKDAGVTVIAYDRLITGTDAVDYYITFDSIAVGKAQGQFLIDNAPNGTGIPLYLYAGAATDSNAFLFFEGAWNILQPKFADGTFIIANASEADALKDKPELTHDEIAAIIGQATTDWDFNVAKSKAQAHLKAAAKETKGDVLVLAPNDGTARSISDVFATDADITSYIITGQDAEAESIQYILDEKQTMSVFKNTNTLASDTIAVAQKILAGETPDTNASYNNGKIDIPSKQTDVTVITKDNAKSLLIDTGYYDASDFTGL